MGMQMQQLPAQLSSACSPLRSNHPARVLQAARVGVTSVSLEVRQETLHSPAEKLRPRAWGQTFLPFLSQSYQSNQASCARALSALERNHSLSEVVCIESLKLSLLCLGQVGTLELKATVCRWSQLSESLSSKTLPKGRQVMSLHSGVYSVWHIVSAQRGFVQ